MPKENTSPAQEPFKEWLWRVIFLADTRAGRTFDVVLLVMILASVIVVMLESVEETAAQWQDYFIGLEWFFTIVFTIEYLLRIWIVRRKSRYLLSFYGIVDLLAILPTYLSLLLGGAPFLMITRVLRLLRIFRILKMPRHLAEADYLFRALKTSQPKIGVFLFGVCILIVIEATLMYLIEGGIEGTEFTSIPQSVYWAVVTFTTVGYGDIAPVTVAGKMLASLVMLTGYSIIAIPTGIISAEVYRQPRPSSLDVRTCNECGKSGHLPAARFCAQCGNAL